MTNLMLMMTVLVKLKTPKTISPIIIPAKLIIQVINSVNNVKTTNKSIKMCFLAELQRSCSRLMFWRKAGVC
jgi:hypothetical protein